MTNMKKAQSAMEYLMTYGWAILIILIAIGALFYLGVFSPSVPNTCQASAPFSCGDILVGDNALLVDLGATNVKGGSLTDISINGESCDSYGDAFLYTIPLEDGKEVVGCVGDMDLTEGDKITSTLDLSYTSQYGGLSHNVDGQASGNVEQSISVPGIIAYYPFAEGIGVVTADYSGNGYDGIIEVVSTSTLEWSNADPLKSGSNYLTFDRVWYGSGYVGSYVELIGNDLDELAEGFTVTAWIKKGLDSGSNAGIVTKGDGTDEEDITFLLRLGHDTNTLLFKVGNSAGVGTESVDAYQDITIGAGWWFIVGVYDKNNNIIKVYAANGPGEEGFETKQVALSEGFILKESVHSLKVGSTSNPTGNNLFEGDIDDVVIYDYALTAEEIQAIYDGYS